MDVLINQDHATAITVSLPITSEAYAKAALRDAIVSVKNGLRFLVFSSVIKLIALIGLVIVAIPHVAKENLIWVIQPSFNNIGPATLLLFFSFQGYHTPCSYNGLCCRRSCDGYISRIQTISHYCKRRRIATAAIIWLLSHLTGEEATGIAVSIGVFSVIFLLMKTL